METSFALLFYPKKRRSYTEGPIPIYFRIVVDGIEREISTKLEADPEKWSSDANRLQGKSDAVKGFNDYLDILQTKAINARTHLKEDGLEVSGGANNFLKFIKTELRKNHCLIVKTRMKLYYTPA